MTKEQDSAEVVRKLTERNKIADFAMQVLHMDEIRADAFVKVCGDRFTWDGTLKFKGLHGEVAADDPVCTGFCEREILGPVFGMTKKSEGDSPTLAPDLIAKAKLGNITAKSQLFIQLHGDKPKSAEAETLAALDKVLAGDTTPRDDKGKFVADDTKGKERSDASNPWSKAGWNITAQGRAAKNDFERAKRLAAAAGSFIGATRAT